MCILYILLYCICIYKYTYVHPHTHANADLQAMHLCSSHLHNIYLILFQIILFSCCCCWHSSPSLSCWHGEILKCKWWKAPEICVGNENCCWLAGRRRLCRNCCERITLQPLNAAEEPCHFDRGFYFSYTELLLVVVGVFYYYLFASNSFPSPKLCVSVSALQQHFHLIRFL